MNRTITILWPEKIPPEIEEVQFSYYFCRRMSRDYCKEVFLTSCIWIDAPVDKYKEQISRRVTGEMTLVVTDPEIVLSSVAVSNMIKAIGNRHAACGPVYNQSDFPSQIAELPAPYVNMATYLEMVKILSEREERGLVPVDALDPSCILYKTDYLRDLIKNGCSLGGSGKAIVANSALIHRFGDYYDGDREDLIRLVPDRVKRILDVGCAMGGYGKRLKRERPDIHLTGVELNPVMAKFAKRHYDEVITSPIEDTHFPDNFDLINCGDILEHLRDPWKMLKRFYDLLRRGGFLVMSVPNAAHWSIVRDLLKGSFQYIPVGLLCLTHIRWFTESSIQDALEDAGFVVDHLQRQQNPATPEGEEFIRKICDSGYGKEECLRTNEIIIRAIKK